MIQTLKQQNRPPVVAVDFDGTINDIDRHRSPGDDEVSLDEVHPQDGVREAMERLRSSGVYIVIWTASIDDTSNISAWLDRWGIPYDEINASKYDESPTPKIAADLYIDDRAMNPDGQRWWDVSTDAIIELLGKARQPIDEHDGYDELKELAEQGQAELENLLSKLNFRTVRIDELELGELEWTLHQPGGTVVFAPVKGEKRATEKVESDYDGDWRKLLDVVRAAVAVDSMQELGAAVEAVKAAGGFVAKPPKDRFDAPLANGYRDLLVNLRLPCGLICEVQFHLKPMLIAREREKLAYDVVRAIQASMEEEGREDMTPAEAEACRRARKASQHIYARAWEECQANEGTG